MRLTHLILSNIGPFRGTHIIDMTSPNSATGYAFFAKNSRGKTTIYNAMRWCLFGEARERGKIVNGKRISGSIRPIVGDGKILMNDSAYEHDDQQEMSVMLIAEGKNGSIQVNRSAKSTTKFARTDEQMEVSLDVTIGSKPLVSGKKAQEAIETFFPRGLERFFFIDGESLEEYTEMMESNAIEGLQDEVNAVLGIPALVKGSDDLNFLHQTLKSKIDKTSKALKQSTSARDDLIAQKRVMQEKMATVAKKQNELTTVVGKLDDTLEKMNANKELAPLLEELKSLETQITLKQANLVEAAKDKVSESTKAWKVLLWSRASTFHSELTAQKQNADDCERIIQSTKVEILNIEESINLFKGICETCHQPLQNIEKHKSKLQNDLNERQSILARLESSVNHSPDDLIIALGELQKLKPQPDWKERILKSEQKWKRMCNDLESLNEQKTNINSKVSEEAKSSAGELGELKGRQEVMVHRRQQELREARKDVDLAELELKRLERLSGNTSQDKESLLLNNIIGKLQVAIRDTIASYREKARSEVEKCASEVFVKLNNSPEVYTGIKVDKNFRTQIRNSKGGFERSPSSGLTSMMTISVIDALRQVSGIDAPVFLDTPARSLDEEHKKDLLDYFWQSEGHQFLIFAHSGEYNVEETVREHKGMLAKAWTLTYPRDHSSCYLESCLSTDVFYDSSSKKYSCQSCQHEWNTETKETIVSEVKL